MRQILMTLLILSYILSFSQVRIFSGHIDKYPIQLVTYSYSDGDTRAIYAYDKHDTPIIIDGRQKSDSLILFEKNDKGEIAAILKFQKFNPKNKEIYGKWISQSNQTIFDIKLTKLHEFDSYDKIAFEKIEFMQPESTKDNYFKLLISKNEGDNIQVIGVRIYEKKTDRLIQELDLECQFLGLNNISVFDYNFDGIDDFSVFESSYAGPNTSSIYILKDPKSGKYFISEISGGSLDFDSGSKLIYEHNQCCAGRSHRNATYKLVDNKMVLIEQRCLEYDDEKEDFIEKDCD
ncbi:MAG: XAC2610-related protein [Flavobacterium sp.]